ncbi:unnamed protein product [Anisakis simplex]|uniref:3-hydroxyisobutyryl-CoA hydrolase, mitochondrial n=1 Tax=Anisakis simplex TaxID=6269 RepID=A0A0M3JV10_ANISI|nr:unnamed protein product [Anisakis simplex]
MNVSKLSSNLLASTKLLASVKPVNSATASAALRSYSSANGDGPVFTERLSGEHEGIVLLRMADKTKKNAIDKRLLDCFLSHVDALKADKDSRVVIVKSDVPGTFCAGADLKERAKMADEDVLPFVDKIRALTTNLADLPVPVIASINGWALGGGLEIALGADIRVSSWFL